jgi:hypothetical protein
MKKALFKERKKVEFRANNKFTKYQLEKLLETIAKDLEDLYEQIV